MLDQLNEFGFKDNDKNTKIIKKVGLKVDLVMAELAKSLEKPQPQQIMRNDEESKDELDYDTQVDRLNYDEITKKAMKNLNAMNFSNT